MLLVASLPSNCNSDFLMLLRPWNKNVCMCACLLGQGMCIYNAIINHDSNLWCGNNISYEMILVAPILNFVHGVVMWQSLV